MSLATHERELAPDLTQLSATEPPEARGLARDEVRLLVAGDGPVRHLLFHDLGSVLAAGDLVVVNTSATLPAAVDGRRGDGSSVLLHVSGPASDGDWIVELRRPDRGRVLDARIGELIELPGGVTARLLLAHPDGRPDTGSRLWVASISAPLPDYLTAAGRPITYDYIRGQWPLETYQTIFAREPGSAEMPSAGRPFSPRMLVDLTQRGIAVAPVLLHTGVSSLEAGELPQPERYRVPAATARLVNATRDGGGRVIAVGTTVTRALATVMRSDGSVSPGHGWTDLVVEPGSPPRGIDGLITGWHEPDASHLLLLEAVAGRALVAEAYAAAHAERYRWHEFGDSCLLLRPSKVVPP